MGDDRGLIGVWEGVEREGGLGKWGMMEEEKIR